MNKIKKFFFRAKKQRTHKLEPHEKAELGQGNWGRQSAKTEPIVSISARVIRKDGTIENLGIISGGE